MAYKVQQFTPLVAGTSGAFTFTNSLKHLDDASNIMIVVASSAGSVSYQIAVSYLDPDYPASLTQGYTSTSTTALGFYPLQPASVTSSIASTGGITVWPGNTVILSAVAFNQVRLNCTGGDTAGTIIGWAAKQITV